MARKVLLADDSLTIQKVVELTFSDSDYELLCVSNGQRALEKVREALPDLILADVVMPEKNGYEVCEAIKSDPATARIPVVLLSGTFEPFDRERAERIGADAIVSKPFDSQQLLSQVEALLDRSSNVAAPVSSGTRPITAAPAPPSAEASPLKKEKEEKGPFDVGFSGEDFTASIRLPPRRDGLDPFEEEYGRGDVDSAIEAFERAHPDFARGKVRGSDTPGSTEPVAKVSEAAPSPQEPLAPWLPEEPERAAASGLVGAQSQTSAKPEEAPEGLEFDQTDASRSVTASARSDEVPTVEIPKETVVLGREPEAEDLEPVPEEASVAAAPVKEITATEAEVFFEVFPPEPAKRPDGVSPAIPEAESGSEPAAGRSASTTEVPREIEMLAKTASIPELTKMLSNVARSGNDWTEEQIERLARRVLEKLSDRIVREIAWEVVPDMAEIVIKQRIKELESGVE